MITKVLTKEDARKRLHESLDIILEVCFSELVVKDFIDISKEVDEILCMVNELEKQ